MKRYYVYIMSNVSKMTGMTNDLTRRIEEHQETRYDGFTERYNIHQLVYYEEFQNPQKAIGREEEIKGWRREKKAALIEKVNSAWQDLSK